MIKSIAIGTILATGMFSAVHEFQQGLPVPIQIQAIGRPVEDSHITDTRKTLVRLNAPPERVEKLTKSCYASYITTGIDPVLLACIIPSESEYKINAVSPLGYKSLMQTPKAVMKWEYAEVNVVYGACKLKEKLEDAKGNMEKALTWYKGSPVLVLPNGKLSLGHKQALEVLTTYNRVKKELKKEKADADKQRG